MVSTDGTGIGNPPLNRSRKRSAIALEIDTEQSKNSDDVESGKRKDTRGPYSPKAPGKLPFLEHSVEFHLLAVRFALRQEGMQKMLFHSRTPSRGKTRSKNRLRGSAAIKLSFKALTSGGIRELQSSNVALTAHAVSENAWGIDNEALLQEEKDLDGNPITLGLPCFGLDTIPETESDRKSLSLVLGVQMTEQPAGALGVSAPREWYGETMQVFDQLELPSGVAQEHERWIRMELKPTHGLGTTPMVALILLQRIGSLSRTSVPNSAPSKPVAALQVGVLPCGNRIVRADSKHKKMVRYLSLAGLWLSLKAEKAFTWAAAYSK